MNLDDLENENLELKLELAGSRAEGEKLRSQLETMTKIVERLTRSDYDLNNQLNMATKVIGDSRAELDELHFRIGSADVEIKLYKTELQDMRNKLLESEKESKTLREQLEDFKSGAYLTRTQTESSINFRLSTSYAQGEDDADFGVGHDLIHDHDHKETESKIHNLEKLVEELHDSLHHAEEENESLKVLIKKNDMNNKTSNEVVNTVVSLKLEMASQLKAKDDEIATLRASHEESLHSLQTSKDEEILKLKKLVEELEPFRKAFKELEAEKVELQQQYEILSARQDYLAHTVPSSYAKLDDATGLGIANNRASSTDLISTQTSLERAIQLYVTEEKNDDILQEMSNLVSKFEKLKTRNTTLLNKLQSARGNIQVCCRTRPPSSDEMGTGGKVIVDGYDESELSCYDWKIESWKSFGFDHVWPPVATQADVFSDIEPLIASVADGFNVCIFAYGQTGSGKTYTMEGYGTDYGIYYRSIQKLFELVQSKSFGTALTASSTNGSSSNNNNNNNNGSNNNASSNTTSAGPGKKPPMSHLPSSAHAIANQRRQSATNASNNNNNGLSSLEKVFGAVNAGRNSGTAAAVGGKIGALGSENGSKASSFRSDSDTGIQTPSDQLSDSGNEGANGAAVSANINVVPLPSSSGGNKSLVKQPSMFEFSNPISRRRSTLHVSHSSSETKKDPSLATADDYGFLAADREDTHPAIKARIEMSMLEIYNEQVYDLLTDRWISTSTNSNFNTSTSNNNNNNNGSNGNGNGSSMALDLRQGTDGQVNVQGLSTIEVKDMQEAMSVFAKGASNRATASTQLNAHSSRSHLIVQIDLITEGLDDAAGIHSKLFLVDLAGSERIEKSGATGSVLKEAQYINKSLLALGDVMEALDKKQSHIPYRNSKLTHLLQNALGGNARCMMIANVCPTDLTYDETMFTLQFATRVRNINLGVAHRNSNVKNLEEALKVTRSENRELKRKRTALEEALNIAKKEGSTGKIGDKFSEAKIRQLEETKKVAESLIQQLQRQLHDANAKFLEERRLREQASVDAELLQRNLKKTTDQLKHEQEKTRKMTSSSSAGGHYSAASSANSTPHQAYGSTSSSNNNSKYSTPLRHPTSASAYNTPGTAATSATKGTPASASSTSSTTSNHNNAMLQFPSARLLRAPSPVVPAAAKNLPNTPVMMAKRSREPSPAPHTTPTKTPLSKAAAVAGLTNNSHGNIHSNNSSNSKIPVAVTAASTATTTTTATTAKHVDTNTKNNHNNHNNDTSSSSHANNNGHHHHSPLSSPSSETKRSSPYKAAFNAMLQKQQQQQQQQKQSGPSPTGSSTNNNNNSTISNSNSNSSNSNSNSNSFKKSSGVQPASSRARSALQRSMDSTDDEEVFQVLIPDSRATTNTSAVIAELDFTQTDTQLDTVTNTTDTNTNNIASVTPSAAAADRNSTAVKHRPTLGGEKQVSLDKILDDLSVASVDDISLTELSLSTGVSSHQSSHATSTLARRIAKNNPGLFQPGIVDADLVSAINDSNKNSNGKTPRTSANNRHSSVSGSSGSASGKRHTAAAAAVVGTPQQQKLQSAAANTITTTPRKSPSHALRPSATPSPSAAKSPLLLTTTSSSRLSSSSSPAAAAAAHAGTASARAAMVTTSSSKYRKPSPSPSKANNNNNNNNNNDTPDNMQQQQQQQSKPTPPAVPMSAFSQSGNHPGAAAQLRQVINNVSQSHTQQQVQHTPVSSSSGNKRSSTSSTTPTSAASAKKSPATTPHTNTTTNTTSGKAAMSPAPRTPLRSPPATATQKPTTPITQNQQTPSSQTQTQTMRQMIEENNAPYQQHIPIPALQKTPPSITDRARAALDIHKNRMAAKNNAVTTSPALRK